MLTKFRYLFSIIYLFPKLFSEICPFSEAFENSKNYKKTQKKTQKKKKNQNLDLYLFETKFASVLPLKTF